VSETNVNEPDDPVSVITTTVDTAQGKKAIEQCLAISEKPRRPAFAACRSISEVAITTQHKQEAPPP